MPAMDIPSLFQPSPSTSVPVIDPPLKEFGRVWISLQHIIPTAGLARYQSGHPYPPSMCLLYQQQRCQAGVHCNQIHADREFVATVRLLLKSVPHVNCCAAHGDLPSTRRDFASLCQKARFVLKLGDGTAELNGSDIAATAFWEKVMAKPLAATEVVTITPGEVCYLHQQSNCKYGVDCKHVHICRAKFAEVAARLGNLPTAATTTAMTTAPVSAAATTILKTSPRRTLASPRVMPQIVSANKAPVIPMVPLGVSALGPVGMLPVPPSLLLAMGAMLTSVPAPPAPVISVSPPPPAPQPPLKPQPRSLSMTSLSAAAPHSGFGPRSFTEVLLPTSHCLSPATAQADAHRGRRHSAPVPALLPLKVSSLQAVLDEALAPQPASSSSSCTGEGCSPTSSDSTAQRLLRLMETPTSVRRESSAPAPQNLAASEQCVKAAPPADRPLPVFAISGKAGADNDDEEDEEASVAARRSPLMPQRPKAGSPGVSSRGFVGAYGSPTELRSRSAAPTLRGVTAVPLVQLKKASAKPVGAEAAWADKAASSRGRFRGVAGTTGGLPTQQTRGPSTGVGFQAGRGKPL